MSSEELDAFDPLFDGQLNHFLERMLSAGIGHQTNLRLGGHWVDETKQADQEKKLSHAFFLDFVSTDEATEAGRIPARR